MPIRHGPLLPIGLRKLRSVVFYNVHARYKSILECTEAHIMKVSDGNGLSWG